MTPEQEIAALLEKTHGLHEKDHRRKFTPLRPILADFLAKMTARPEDRAKFAAGLEQLVEWIDYPHSPNGLYAAREIIGYTMKDLKWPEVGLALKERYEREPDASIQLWIEQLIRNIYDKEWAGGVCVSVPGEDIWEETWK